MKSKQIIACILVSSCLGCTAADSSSSAKQKDTLIWKVKPSLDYDSVKPLEYDPIDIIFDSGDFYWGDMKGYPVQSDITGYSEDVVIVSKDGKIGLNNYEGQVLQDTEYLKIQNLDGMNVGYKYYLSTGNVSNGCTGYYYEYLLSSDFTNITEDDNTADACGVGGDPGSVISLNHEMIFTDGDFPTVVYPKDYYLLPEYEDINSTDRFGYSAYDSSNQYLYTIKYVPISFRNGIIEYCSKEAVSYDSRTSLFTNNSPEDSAGTYDKSYPVGFINGSDGTVITDAIYDDAYYFTDHYAAVKRDGLWTYIDETGKEVMEPVFEDATPLYHGLAYVKKDGKWGILDLYQTLGKTFTE